MKIGTIIVAIALFSATAYSQNTACLVCHSAAAHKAHPTAQVVDTTILSGSAHAQAVCTDCHTINAGSNHKGNRVVFCARCHQKEAEGFNRSPHVKGRQANIEKLPTCITCHGGHDVKKVADPLSPTHHDNSVKICIKCHEDAKVTAQVEKLPKPAVIKAYEKSVHGRELMDRGNEQAPGCVDCHGSHSFLPADEPESPVYKTHIAETCGQCHRAIAATYDESVHGKALAEGVLESPTCTSCHGEHDIRPPTDSTSRVFKGHVAKTCSDCHASEKIVARFGLKPDRIATFQESFHGAAGQLGDLRVANCASCHGVHDIFAQSDPRSKINKANIEVTCGKCHKDLPADFAKASVHTSASDPASGGEFFVRKFYIWFISALILLFLIYRILEYKRRVKRVGMSGQ
ncbi:MAG: hypothetical protein HY851_07365 [candidate division Zixibacteria bacterium]|nr:hypothetical protein [candidate division Zixibacteria bacterium]